MEEDKKELLDYSVINTGAVGADTMYGKYLTFWTDGELFGIPIAQVVQIIGIQKITPVPEFADYVKGIINLRGSIIPVVDMRARFGKAEQEYNEKTCIIVTNINEAFVGFIVDSVEEVTNIDDEDIAPPPTISSDYTNTFITGIGKADERVTLLLDIKKILNLDMLNMLGDITLP